MIELVHSYNKYYAHRRCPWASYFCSSSQGIFCFSEYCDYIEFLLRNPYSNSLFIRRYDGHK